jgi:hypothetical protein
MPSPKHASIALATVVGVVLVAARADAGPPPESCQTTAPHHTQTLGPSVDAVTFTSSLAYWNNACGCYIAQVDVPSTSSPTNLQTRKLEFGFTAAAVNALPDNKAECESYKLRVYVYKKEGNDWSFKYGGHTTATWHPNATFPHPRCEMSSNYTPTSFTPPASGTDKYRVLVAAEMSGKNKPVTVNAQHTVIPQNPN